MSARPHPFHQQWKDTQAGAPDPALGLALPKHRWRVSHVDAAGQRRMAEVTAATSWLAINWVEQLHGTPRVFAAIRLSPRATTTTH